jgi:hypothetical protein
MLWYLSSCSSNIVSTCRVFTSADDPCFIILTWFFYLISNSAWPSFRARLVPRTKHPGSHRRALVELGQTRLSQALKKRGWISYLASQDCWVSLHHLRQARLEIQASKQGQPAPREPGWATNHLSIWRCCILGAKLSLVQETKRVINWGDGAEGQRSSSDSGAKTSIILLGVWLAETYSKSCHIK